MSIAELTSANAPRQIAVSPVREREAWSEIEEEFKEGLRGYWYVITSSDEIAEAPSGKPLAIKRMGEDLAVWRDGTGKVRVMTDRCPHRGAKLSLGHVGNSTLQCWYHGWRYDAEGNCIDVPSEGNACTFRGEVKVKTYVAEEHGGLVYAYFPAEGSESAPPPPCPVPYELESSEWSGFILRHPWAVRWFRIMENVLDPFHAPFLHAKTFTLSNNKTFQDTIVVDKNPNGNLHVYRKGQKLVNFDEVEYQFPNFARLDVPYPWSAGPGGPMRILFTSCPVDGESTQVYVVRKRKITGWRWWLWKALWHLRLKAKMWIVMDQDKAILLSQANGEALKSEYLVQGDMGIVRMRNLFREAYRKKRSQTK